MKIITTGRLNRFLSLSYKFGYNHEIDSNYLITENLIEVESFYARLFLNGELVALVYQSY